MSDTVLAMLIICATLVLFAVFGLCAWLMFLKYGGEIARDHGSDRMAAFTAFVRAWPNPLAWVGETARAILPATPPSAVGARDSSDVDQVIPDESPDEAA